MRGAGLRPAPQRCPCTAPCGGALLRAAGHHSVRRGTAPCVWGASLSLGAPHPVRHTHTPHSPATLRTAPPHYAQPCHTTRSTPTAGGRFAAPHPSPSVYIRKYLHLYSYICERLYVQLFVKATNLTPSFTFV